MANSNSNSPQFRADCAKLWEDIKGTTVDRFSKCIRLHPKSQFLGHVDITYNMVGRRGVVAPLKIRGIGVKILNGKPHLEMPAEKGSDGTFYPTVFPKSGELRSVLTTLVFANLEVAEAINEAAAQVAQAQDQGSNEGSSEGSSQNEDSIAADNPFNPGAPEPMLTNEDGSPYEA